MSNRWQLSQILKQHHCMVTYIALAMPDDSIAALWNAHQFLLAQRYQTDFYSRESIFYKTKNIKSFPQSVNSYFLLALQFTSPSLLGVLALYGSVGDLTKHPAPLNQLQWVVQDPSEQETSWCDRKVKICQQGKLESGQLQLVHNLLAGSQQAWRLLHSPASQLCGMVHETLVRLSSLSSRHKN